MATAIKVSAEVRSATGSSAGRRMRRSGVFPGVVYGVGKAPLNVQLDERSFKRAIGHHRDEQVMLDLDVQGVELKKVLLKEVQHHPLSGQILHADFHEVSMTETLTIEIAVNLVGEPVGVSQKGGTLEHLVRSIEVECLPSDIVDSFDVDVSALDLGDSLTAGDVKLDAAKYTLVTDADLAIAAVSAPRAEEAPAAAAAATEPEVLKEKKEEGAAPAGADKGKAAAPAKDAKK
ncbi:MAG: 50S ribosomal protein L25 [Kiritimatiellae bacterium]|nr:50S ribosomal protein L25 [Kiritimatiellia bacterium]MCO6400424.1 50S ribosomal protein L25 [Verrucomicrobiota bacterium]